jgi:hypothetical protein
MTWINEPRPLIHQLLLMAERENSPKSKLFGIVACLKTGLAESSHPIDQHGQAQCHFRFSSLIINPRWEQMFVQPLRGDMHINKNPLLGGSLEAGIQVFLLTVAT